MTVHVRLFARLRDLAGTDLLVIDLPAGATVADLRRYLAGSHPLLGDLLHRSRVALGDELAGESVVLCGREEVALLPPVSGG